MLSGFIGSSAFSLIFRHSAHDARRTAAHAYFRRIVLNLLKRFGQIERAKLWFDFFENIERLSAFLSLVTRTIPHAGRTHAREHIFLPLKHHEPSQQTELRRIGDVCGVAQDEL
jgi:hypothetical protein